eukprot:1944161-Rhodomonas_salina.1
MGNKAEPVPEEVNFDVHVNKDSSRVRRERELDHFCESFAQWTPSTAAERAFDDATIDRFLCNVQNEGFIADVIGFSEFPYSRGNTLEGRDREIETEFWFEINTKDSALSGEDGLVILHVHYAGKWHFDWWKRDRSTVTQINIRHTTSYEEKAFHRKCQDLGKWREKYGKPLLQNLHGGWKWRDHPDRFPTVYKLLDRAEKCEYEVRGYKGKE